MCSYLFYPIAYFMGADVPDCRQVATLVAKKTFTNEYIAYFDLAKIINNKKTLYKFLESRNASSDSGRIWWWNNDDVIYNNGTHNVTLSLGIMSVNILKSSVCKIFFWSLLYCQGFYYLLLFEFLVITRSQQTNIFFYVLNWRAVKSLYM